MLQKKITILQTENDNLHKLNDSLMINNQNIKLEMEYSAKVIKT